METHKAYKVSCKDKETGRIETIYVHDCTDTVHAIAAVKKKFKTFTVLSVDGIGRLDMDTINEVRETETESETETETKLICNECGDTIEQDEEITIDGGTYCPECTITCAECNQITLSSNSIQSDRYGVLCEDCGNELVQCTNCDEYFFERDIGLSGNHTNICGDCAENFFVCESCGNIQHNDYAYHTDDGDLCASCYDGRSTRYIHDCGYKPYSTSSYLGICPVNKRLYGLEIETTVSGYDVNEHAEYLHDELSNDEDLFILKSDGSIGDNGFEIVTNVASLEYHCTEFPYLKIMSHLMDNGFRSHDNPDCGLHIHVNRKAVSYTEQCKLAILYYSNLSWFKLFSRRNNNDYCKPKKVEHKAQLGYSADRYEAINFTNRSTIEFRFFRGTLIVDTIKASIQLVDVMLSTVQAHNSIEITKNSLNRLIETIKESGYTELISYCTKKNLLTN